MTETNEEVEKIKRYLKASAAFYGHYAKLLGVEADAVRAQMCNMILSDIEQKGRLDLMIERLEGSGGDED